MNLKEIIATIDQVAPFSLQESYDNSGIQYGDPDKEIHKGLVCIDITERIIEEAQSTGCDLIISHHPLLFKGMKSITGNHYTQRTLVKAIRQDIALVSVHTNLDFVQKGVNRRLAQKLGLTDLSILDPKPGILKKMVVFCPVDHADGLRDAIFKAGAGYIGDYDCCSFNLEGKGSFRAGDQSNPFVGEKGEIHFENEVRIETIFPAFIQSKLIAAMISAHPYEEVAYDIYPLENKHEKTGGGMIGFLEDELPEELFLEQVKEVLHLPVVRHNGFSGRKLKKIAICGGSGSFLMNAASRNGADAFLTADIKFHEFFEYQNEMLIADVGHYESEQFTTEILVELLKEKFANFALQISKHSTNPVHYF